VITPATSLLHTAIRIGAPTLLPRTDYNHLWSGDNIDATTIFDQGSRPFDLTRNAAVITTTGQVGLGLEAGSFVSSPLRGANAGLIADDQFTFMTWIKRDGTSWVTSSGITVNPFAGGADFANRGWYIASDNVSDTYTLIIGDNVLYVPCAGFASQTILDNVWMHVCWTYDNGTGTGDGFGRSFLNGQPISTSPSTFELVYDQTPIDIYMLGRNRINETSTNLAMNYTKQWGEILTDQEIQTIYNSEA